MKLRCLTVLLLVTFCPARDVKVTTSHELHKAAANAEPGDRLILNGGPFRDIHLQGLRGTRDQPIILQGGSAQQPASFRGGKTGIQLSRCQWLELRFLDIHGAQWNGINIDDGGNRDQPAHHITITDCSIRSIGPKGNFDALKLSGLDHFVIRRCRFTGWGGSAIDMVGCHHGLIESCHFEGQEGFSQNSGIQLKGGTSDVAVLANDFHDAGLRAINLGGSTGLQFFRPHVGEHEAEDIEVAGNRIRGSDAAIAFVTSRAGHVHHNTIHLPEKWVLRILQENADHPFKPVCDGVFESNLIILDQRVRTHVNIGPGTAAETFTFRNNVWFDLSNPPRKPVLPGKVIDEVHGENPGIDLNAEDPASSPPTHPRLNKVGAHAYRAEP